MTLNRYLLSAAFGAIAAMLPGAAYACRCVSPKTPQEAYSQADAVVLGEVVAVAGNYAAEGGAIATLKPNQAWKTGVPATLRVETRTTCAFNFHKGQTYLVYLSHSGARAPYSTTICDGNQPEGKASAALKWLQDSRKPVSIGQ